MENGLALVNTTVSTLLAGMVIIFADNFFNIFYFNWPSYGRKANCGKNVVIV